MVTLGLSINAKIISACLFIEDEFIALESEKNNRLNSSIVKLPVDSINKCLSAGQIHFNEIDTIIISDNLNIDFKKRYELFLSIKIPTLKKSAYNILLNSNNRHNIEKRLKKIFLHKTSTTRFSIFYSCSNESITNYCFYASGFTKSSFLNFNSQFNYFSQILGEVSESSIKIIDKQEQLNSLTYLYKCFTTYFGFKNEFKEFMKVSIKGRIIHKDKIWKLLIRQNEAKYILNPQFIKLSPELLIGEYIGLYNFEDFINFEQFEILFGPKRIKNTILTEDQINIITSFVSVLQTIIADLLNMLFSYTHNENLCLNSDFYGILNEDFILNNTEFKSIYFGNYESIFEDIAMGAAMKNI